MATSENTVPQTPLAYPWSRRLAALAIAVASDALNAVFTWLPPVAIGIDMVTAVALWLVLGRPMILLPALLAEAIPGVGIIPLWTIVAGGLAFFGRMPGRSRLGPSADGPAPRTQHTPRDQSP